MLAAFLLELPHREHHVDGRPACSKAALRLRVNTLSKKLQSFQYDSGVGFANDTQQRNATVVIAIAFLPFVLV